jgi:hypothetical protein
MTATVHELKPLFCYCCAKALTHEDEVVSGTGTFEGYEWHAHCHALISDELIASRDGTVTFNSPRSFFTALGIPVEDQAIIKARHRAHLDGLNAWYDAADKRLNAATADVIADIRARRHKDWQ